MNQRRFRIGTKKTDRPQRRGPPERFAPQRDARSRALEMLARAEQTSSFVNELLQTAAHDATLSPLEHRLLEKLVRGVLENHSFLFEVLDQRVDDGFEGLSPSLRRVLLLGAYQIIFLDRTAVQIAVDSSVELAKRTDRQHGANLVNAVLRRVSRELPEIRASRTEPEADDPALLATFFSHPEWLVSRWLTQWGSQNTREMLRANNQPAPLYVRVNTLLATKDALLKSLQSEGVKVLPVEGIEESLRIVELPRDRKLHELQAFCRGYCTVQDLSSLFAVIAAAPQPGETVIDLCAAPGGKTLHAASRMQNQGRILAVDVHRIKLSKLADTVTRLGAKNVELIEADGANYAPPVKADVVLVDAPCSGFGVIGKRADLRWAKDESQCADLHALQVALLKNAAAMLKPGGRIVYSTCTIEPLENEETTAAVLKEVQNLKPCELPLELKPFAISPSEYRTWPHKHACGGAYGRLLRLDN